MHGVTCQVNLKAGNSGFRSWAGLQVDLGHETRHVLGTQIEHTNERTKPLTSQAGLPPHMHASSLTCQPFFLLCFLQEKWVHVWRENACTNSCAALRLLAVAVMRPSGSLTTRCSRCPPGMSAAPDELVCAWLPIRSCWAAAGGASGGPKCRSTQATQAALRSQRSCTSAWPTSNVALI